MTTFQTDSIVDQYFHEIEGSVGLSSADEVAIAQRIKEGDEEALSELVKANLRFVVSVAKQYQNLGLPLSDLINEGNLGLIIAAKRFDGTKGLSSFPMPCGGSASRSCKHWPISRASCGCH